MSVRLNISIYILYFIKLKLISSRISRYSPRISLRIIIISIIINSLSSVSSEKSNLSITGDYLFLQYTRCCSIKTGSDYRDILEEISFNSIKYSILDRYN